MQVWCNAILIRLFAAMMEKALFISKERYTFQSLKNALSLPLCREDIANALEERENLIRSDVLRDITYGAFYQYFVGNDGVQ